MSTRMGFAPIPRATIIASIRAMANELLDFVMSLVRDPDAAARYHADPARTIAESSCRWWVARSLTLSGK